MVSPSPVVWIHQSSIPSLSSLFWATTKTNPNSRPTHKVITFTLIALLLFKSIVDCSKVISNGDLEEESSRAGRIYTNEFAINIDAEPHLADSVADAIAQKHGFINRGKVSSIEILSRLANSVNS